MTIAPSFTWRSGLGVAALIAFVMVTGSGFGVGFYFYRHPTPVALVPAVAPACVPTVIAATAGAKLPPPTAMVSAAAQGARHAIRYARADFGADRDREIGYINLTDRPDEDFLPNMSMTLVENVSAARPTRR